MRDYDGVAVIWILDSLEGEGRYERRKEGRKEVRKEGALEPHPLPLLYQPTFPTIPSVGWAAGWLVAHQVFFRGRATARSARRQQTARGKAASPPSRVTNDVTRRLWSTTAVGPSPLQPPTPPPLPPPPQLQAQDG